MSHTAVCIFLTSFCLIFRGSAAESVSSGGHLDNWAYRLILDDHVKSNPWEKPKPIILRESEIEKRTVADQEYWAKWIKDNEYNPKTDFLKVPAWLEAARKGDMDALYRLKSYIDHNPKWRHRFEIRKALSENQGAQGVARYYSELFNARDEPGFGRVLTREEAMIRSGVSSLIEEAEAGNLDASFALYRFFSFLTTSGLKGDGVHSPWGVPEEMCAQYLERSYQIGGVTKVDIAVQNHVRRLGWINLVGEEVYPHTPHGWKPRHKR